MRVPNSYRDRELRTDQAMTPMIDVVFLLLIFFVCASVGQIHESLLPIDLSTGNVQSAHVEPAPPTEPAWATEIWLKLYPSPTGEQTYVELHEREFRDWPSLEQTLRELGRIAPESPVVLDVDPDVPAGDLVRVDDACRAAGFTKINYAADAASLKP